MMVFQELINGKLDGIEDDLEPMYEEMSKHIALQRKRLGGNMAIAQADIETSHNKNFNFTYFSQEHSFFKTLQNGQYLRISACS